MSRVDHLLIPELVVMDGVPGLRYVSNPAGLPPDVGMGIGQTKPCRYLASLGKFNGSSAPSAQKDAPQHKCLHVVPKASLTPG